MWSEDSTWESNWWGNCLATCYHETTKQLGTYAPKMGLKVVYDSQGPHIGVSGSILDVGGGPCSMTLLCSGFSNVVVLDPCDYPNWTMQRYSESGMTYIKDKGENILKIPEISSKIFDEVWIYNVLQHVEHPAKIVKNMRSVSKIIRIFEWVDTYIAKGHPNILTEKDLNQWLGGNGRVEDINENNCFGRCYYGIFKGNHYE
jgi:ubiquinone/menaquinone biosynthesis C-methylase UbiE